MTEPLGIFQEFKPSVPAAALRRANHDERDNQEQGYNDDGNGDQLFEHARTWSRRPM